MKPMKSTLAGLTGLALLTGGCALLSPSAARIPATDTKPAPLLAPSAPASTSDNLWVVLGNCFEVGGELLAR